MTEVKPGIYKHFKGKEYEVIGVGRNTEDPSEESVVYRALYNHPEFGDRVLWFRPKSMFLETKVLDDGTEIPRFEFVRER